ncbi:M3 family oligoendopeptidase [Halalkalibacter hemicellulosilyticus]|uniref:Oligoendopeptidase F n=1 Tax=Halalkalibacter hemicellulosilyticusJCM 9152 TaxID=1236971 RepID=W4QG92_9BACI|nr:M3 family oligoendopeptidase [Halalkalibacter hemicellulosilyticus]GAE31106.1 oligoendopeptidase F [Halalkalibacter hemicellulosilyticusJCM 9152]
MNYPDVWELSSIFKGGSTSSEFKQFVEGTDDFFNELEGRLQSGIRTVEELESIIVDTQQAMQRVREASAFVSCLTAQNVKDEKATLWQGKITEQSTALQTIWGMIDVELTLLSEAKWKQLLVKKKMKEISFHLLERRKNAKEKLPPAEEKLAAQLAIDGYHAWGKVYQQAVGRMSIPFVEDGQEKFLSAGQLQNLLHDADRQVRERAFHLSEKVWGEEAGLFAATLNHLAGFRTQLYKARGWTSVLKEPLEMNRMKDETLSAMWDTIKKNKQMLYPFMDRKATLLGIKKLAIYDVNAPLPLQHNQSIPYEQACELIISHFKRFSQKLAVFAEGALRDGWVEAENRSHKRPGGFCTTFPLSKQSRIFMTYDGSMSNVATLAHELGHAFHAHCLREKEPLAQRYAMNVAETASTFAEAIVADALVEEADTKEMRIALLDNKISRAIAFFMNIHARFLFETRFYERRKEGMLSAEQLNDLMITAQQEAYGQQLSTYSPTFWASKLHFHITGVPFYNFPYTFGYLFSLGLYKKAQEVGSSYEESYIALLVDTARMSVEELARKHLDVDLTKPDFWQGAIDVVLADIDEFMTLTKE